MLPQVIIAEPYPPPLSEALATTPTTFVAAFAMPNTSIPNNTDLRNFLVPLDVLESVSGMRFFGAVTGATNLHDKDIKACLDREVLRVRATARVPALSGDWGGGRAGKGGGSGTGLPITAGGEAAAALTEGGRTRIFRHLCTTTSCRGL